MEDYNQIIESLSIRYIKAQNINILKSISIENNYEVENTLLLVNKGQVKYGKERVIADVEDVRHASHLVERAVALELLDNGHHVDRAFLEV